MQLVDAVHENIISKLVSACECFSESLFTKGHPQEYKPWSPNSQGGLSLEEWYFPNQAWEAFLNRFFHPQDSNLEDLEQGQKAAHSEKSSM